MTTLLDKAPADLMIVDDDNGTDPYNSGIFRALKKTDVVFLRNDKVLIGDTTTIAPDYYEERRRALS